MFRAITRSLQIKPFRHQTQVFKNVIPQAFSTSSHEMDDFLSVYPDVVKTIFDLDLFNQVPQHNKHFKELLDYNITKTNRYKVSVFLETYKILEDKKNLNEKNLYLANILAWCLELINVYTNIGDDVIDQTDFRGGEPCWHKKENVSLNAFNDAVMVYEAAFIVLKKHFSDNPLYLSLYYLFHRIHISHVIGQTLDWKLRTNRNQTFENFNTVTYMTMARNKGGFSTIEAPFQTAYIFSQNVDYDKIKNIIEEIGTLYQINNDILGVFQKGEVKTDLVNHIRQGQCTWLAVQVLEHGNSDSIKTFIENYGRPTSECERKIIDLYLKMDLYSKYVEHKTNTFQHIYRCVNEISSKSLQNAILNLYAKIDS